MSTHFTGTVQAADGTELWYEVSGRAAGTAPAIALCDGVGCDGFVWKYLRQLLEPHFTVVHPHYRGHGKSGPAPSLDHYRIADCVGDLFTVMDAAGVNKAITFGHSMGVQVALEAALTAPERVTGLVLLCGSFGRPLDTFRDSAAMKDAVPKLVPWAAKYTEQIRAVLGATMPTDLGWTIAAATEVDARHLKKEDFQPYLAHLAGMAPEVFLRTLAEAGKHTTEDRLSSITVPTLVVGAEKDRFTPYWVSEVLAKKVQRGEVRMIRGGTHTAPLEHHELVDLMVEDWLERMSLWPIAHVEPKRAKKKSTTGAAHVL